MSESTKSRDQRLFARKQMFLSWLALIFRTGIAAFVRAASPTMLRLI
jgi:hypothetical protein